MMAKLYPSFAALADISTAWHRQALASMTRLSIVRHAGKRRLRLSGVRQ
jgi:hypothetical protein